MERITQNICSCQALPSEGGVEVGAAGNFRAERTPGVVAVSAVCGEGSGRGNTFPDTAQTNLGGVDFSSYPTSSLPLRTMHTSAVPSPSVKTILSKTTSLYERTEPGHNGAKEEAKTACPSPRFFKKVCNEHLNWSWIKAPCDSWRCDVCRERRLEKELVPEIRWNLRWARSKRQTLKFLTLTYKSDDIGATNDEDGRDRRRLDLAHLAQYIRRDLKKNFEYLRVCEEHKSGAVHLHLLAAMPFISQKLLSDKWQDFSRGSFIVDIRALGMKCPHCWDRDASDKEKRQRMIVPHPGRAKCMNCGYKPEKTELEDAVVIGASWEVGKYLSKAPVGKLTRSRGWRRPYILEDDKQDFSFEYTGEFKDLIPHFPTLDYAADFEKKGQAHSRIAFFKKGGHPCNCFGTDKWIESEAADCWSTNAGGLPLLVLPAHKNALRGLSTMVPEELEIRSLLNI